MTAQAKGFERVSSDDVAFLGTDPVPAAPYYDPDWYELERKAIFLRKWIQVGHVCELPEPGSFIRREMEFANASILIVRGKDGDIRAFHNVCTHRGTQLVEQAEGKQSTFSCPYHRWTFGTDGALLSAPDFEQFHVPKADCALPSIALEICAGLIFISFNPDPTPLREWLAGLAEQLETLPVAHATTFSEYVYDIDANWKLTYDNFQENYHLRFIHPRTGLATLSQDNPFGYPLRYGFNGPHRTQTIWSNPQPKIQQTQAMAFGKGYEAAMRRGIVGGAHDREYFALFPNFFLLGTPVQHFSHTVYPISASQSRGVIRIYWVGEDGNASERFAREFAMATARDIHAEDRAVIEAGQRGLSSGALKHIHFQTQEALCRHLFNGVRDAVEAWKAQQPARGAIA
ncbi:SRPBCC family protein [Sphingomonas sp. LaA6.9]|uniref:aromatic ring-hydroxylating oxygenase subunit alpha n=1 Tax=Sphingomonas sp. LaA6.9 TaxID=2919914 RepID=UPI001F4FB8FD|nr:aromatic ring-hydroxylating dioxygenase subunit alpha [Sphingomonas sp. LaA6.9]MCJ8159801.1 aromatic ring-hydroxylating dioxygenase subunit alpha [Sphingomonas sp. LaA6.9]